MKSPPIDLPVPWIVGLNVGGWLLIQLGLAWAVTRLPIRWFARPPARVRATPRHDFFYERILRIKYWKSRLPDGATWFAGGFAKASLTHRDPAYLARFAAETRRGELCHWLALACLPVFALWNPWWGNLVIAGYAVAANLPCILVQRYNRYRITRCAHARATRRPPIAVA